LSSRTDQARRERQHAQDLQTATELSKTYVRGGDDIDVAEGGNYGEGGSAQRYESVEDRERAEHEAMLREEEELARYERNKSTSTTAGTGYGHDESIYSNTNSNSTTTASPYDGLGALESLKGLDFSSPSPAPAAAPAPARTSFPSSNPYANLSLSTNNLDGPSSTSSAQQQDPFQESPISSSFLPPQPSEKALGKLRRISTTGRTEGEDDSQERQRVLEEQLRDKYRRNLEEQGASGGIREV